MIGLITPRSFLRGSCKEGVTGHPERAQRQEHEGLRGVWPSLPKILSRAVEPMEKRCFFWSEVQWKVALLPMPYNPACTSHHKWTWQSRPGIPSNLALIWPLERRNSGLFHNDLPHTRLKYLAEQSWDPPSFSFRHPLWDLEWISSSVLCASVLH